MYDITPNETYILVFETLVLGQGFLLAYLLALGANTKIKRAVDRTVLSYFLYMLFAIPIGRIQYRETPEGTYDHFGQLYPYLGIDYQTLNATMSTFLVLFVLMSMHLWYALLKRKIDLPMIVAHAVCITTTVLLCINKESLITVSENNQLFSNIFLPIYLYGVVIMGNGLRKMEPGLEKKRLWIFFIAYLLPFICTFGLYYLILQMKYLLHYQ